MKTKRIITTILFPLTLAACSTSPNIAVINVPSPEQPNVTTPKPTPPSKPVIAGNCIAENGKIGRPYTISGVRYTPQRNPNYNKVGTASFYGKKHHGNQTANGERFNMNALSAAHTTLPLPTCVKVTNLKNNKSVVLRVNDRGPFVKGRIIDVSYAAAIELDFVGAGLTEVRVEALK